MSIDTDDRPFDADNHYYEALDAFTRHIPPAWRPRTVEVAEVRGRVRHLLGGQVNRSVTNPTFDPIVKPGCLYGYFRSNPDNRPREEYMRESEPIPAHYRDRDARLEFMDGQKLSAVWMFPTLGVLYENGLKSDPEAVAVTFKAFNRWVEEDWGFNYKDRIFAAPYISLADVGAAVEQLEWALDRGARVVCMRPAAPTTREGPRSPGDTVFDPFWARVNEAGITVAIHGADSGYGSNGYEQDRQTLALDHTPLRILMNSHRPVRDFFSAILCNQLFTRFPNLRLASIENGASYLNDLLKSLRKVNRQFVGYFPDDPVELFCEHVWINPFWEDDVNEVIEFMGPDHVLFGSDWPHAEGLADPLDYFTDVKHLEPAVQDKIMRTNVGGLTRLRPT